jgi:hypothetical protein
MFAAPISGQSLTTPPKNYAWERPPEVTDPEEAMQMHITRLSEPDILEAVLDAFEVGEVDVASLTKGIIRAAVSQGLHTIDVGMLVAPVVHEFIKQAATSAGLQVEDGFEDKAGKEAQKQAVIEARARKQLKAIMAKPKEETPEEEMPVEPVMEEAPVKRGLMAREGV